MKEGIKYNYPIPRGWIVANLNDTFQNIATNGKKIKQKQYLTSGKYPVVDQGQELVGGYFNEEEVLIKVGPPFIVFGDHTKTIKFIDFNFIVGADGVKVLKTKPEIVPKLFFYFIKCIELPDRGYSRHFQFLNNADFPVPPLAEQHRIVAKIEELFSALDKGIESLKTAQQQLKVYRQAVLKYAFEGKLTNPEVREGELPKGWEVSFTGKVLDVINNGYTPSKQYLAEGSGEVPFLKVYNLNFDGTLNYKKNPTFIPREIHNKDLKRSKCLPGDVLINIVGPPLGKVSIVPDLYPEWNINQAIVLFRPNDKLTSKYLSYFLQSPVTIDWLEQTSKATAGQWNVKVSTCREIPITFPVAKADQDKLVQEIESRLSVCDKIEESIAQSLQQAEALRQSILRKAFEGRLVPQDPNDEPASVLLEHIRAARAAAQPVQKNRTKKAKA
jgi:restriction endonuclease S subunit